MNSIQLVCRLDCEPAVPQARGVVFAGDPIDNADAQRHDGNLPTGQPRERMAHPTRVPASPVLVVVSSSAVV